MAQTLGLLERVGKLDLPPEHFDPLSGFFAS
jgi:hypothetical protein